MPVQNTFDPITLTVFGNRCRAAAEAMAYTLYRTAFSTFVKETEDFTTGLATADGQTFASPRELGATWFTGLDYGRAIGMIDGYEDGDICITNDPYSGFLSTHSPDIHLWKPVFHEGRILCFSVAHIHNTDVGGAVPASISRTLTEIHQEGIRITPRKLVGAGRLNRELVDVLLTNVRNPEQNWGDLKAQIAGLNIGERHAREIIAKFGPDGFSEGVEGLMSLAEEQARRALRGIPDGDYSFTDFIDEDSVNGYPCRLHLTLRVRGDEAELDFTGSDPQVQSSLNMPTGGHARHALLMIGVVYVLYALDPSIQLNAGLLRPFRSTAPQGTILNPEFPAAVGLRSISCVRLMGVVLGAFSKAMPGRLPAAPSSGGPIVSVQTRDPRTGQRRMSSIGPVTGGSGGTPHRDGPEGSGGNNGFLKNTPVEINEIELPIKFHRYGLAPDSGGAGLHRGGMATVVEFEVFSPQTVVSARNRDRSRFACWGAAGGQAGRPSQFLLNPGIAGEVNLGNADVITMQPFDVLRIVAGGSGGWGDPLDRAPEQVARDVRRGLVGVEAARASYGVLLNGSGIDGEGTALLRQQIRAARGAAEGGFDFGEGRRDFEMLWDEASYAELTACLSEVPVAWRFYVKHQIFGIRQGPATSAARVRDAFATLLARMPDLQTRASQIV